MFNGFTIAVIIALVCLAAVFAWVLVRYGREKEKGDHKDAKLKKVLEMHDVSKKVVANAPSNDDDILLRLRGKE